MRNYPIIPLAGLVAMLLGGPPAALAQSPKADAPWARLQWSTSASLSHYHEPSISMAVKGPELGLHLRLSDLRGLPRLQLEADVLGGAQAYSSRDGKLSDRATFDARGRVLYQLVPTQADRGLYAGLAYQHSYTDLRGLLMSGTVKGYERENRSIWLAMQWRHGLNWSALPRLQSYQVDLGHMLDGRQHSYLSQVNDSSTRSDPSRYPRYIDLTKSQPWGWYARLQTTIQAERGLLIEPFVAFSKVGRSASECGYLIGSGNCSRSYVEPANNRWQLGLKATWPPN